jgi:hypothetical protein
MLYRNRIDVAICLYRSKPTNDSVRPLTLLGEFTRPPSLKERVICSLANDRDQTFTSFTIQALCEYRYVKRETYHHINQTTH